MGPASYPGHAPAPARLLLAGGAAIVGLLLAVVLVLAALATLAEMHAPPGPPGEEGEAMAGADNARRTS